MRRAVAEDEERVAAPEEPICEDGEGSVPPEELVPVEGEGALPPEEHELRKAKNARAKHMHHDLLGHGLNASLATFGTRAVAILREEHVRRSSTRHNRDTSHLASLGIRSATEIGAPQPQLLCRSIGS